MANNLIQVKRTSVSGRAANTTTLPNPGELALNMTDGIMYSTNGSVVFEVGANLTSQSISTNSLSVGTSFNVVSNGNIGVGTTSPSTKLTIGDPTPTGVTLDPGGVLLTPEGGGHSLQIRKSSATGNPQIAQMVSEGTPSSPTIITTSGRGLGRNSWYGHDGNSYILAARLAVATEGIPALNSMPAVMTFWTNGGAGSDTERMRISSNGNIGIGNTAPSHKLSITGDLSVSGGISANGSLGTTGQVLTSNGSVVYWATAASGSGGGYYYGDNGAVGDAANKTNIFRVNANTLNANVTFAAGENGSAAGPVTVANGVTLTIQSGARVAIV